MSAGVAVLTLAAPAATASTTSELADLAAVTTYTATVDEWSMTVVDGRAASVTGSAPMSLYGDWQSVQGEVGRAVQFNTASSYGVADGTGGRDPKKMNFALGATFRSSAVPDGYSGNLIQKGLWGDPGQVKLQVVPDGGGTVNCRIKGSRAAKFVGSTVLVGDSQWHTALCWSEGRTLGLTVDGRTTTVRAAVGTIANSRPLNVANKTASSTWTDQLVGAIDCAVLATGPDAHAAAAATMPC